MPGAFAQLALLNSGCDLITIKLDIELDGGVDGLLLQHR